MIIIHDAQQNNSPRRSPLASSPWHGARHPDLARAHSARHGYRPRQIRAHFWKGQRHPHNQPYETLNHKHTALYEHNELHMKWTYKLKINSNADYYQCGKQLCCVICLWKQWNFKDSSIERTEFIWNRNSL